MVLGWWVLPALAGLLLAPQTDSEEREAALLFNTGSHLYRQKNWQDASAAFADFLKRFPRRPDSAEAHFLRGYCLTRLGAPKEAAGELEASFGASDAAWAAEARFHHGRSLEALALAKPEGSKEREEGLRAAARSYGAAARIAGKVPSGPPNGVEPPPEAGGAAARRDLRVLAITAEGEALSQAGLLREASAALAPLADARDLEPSPHYPRGLYLLARTLHRQGREKEAIPHYERVASGKGAEAPEAAFYLAMALYEGQREPDLEKAEKALSSFIQANPEHALVPRARLYQGLSLFDRKRYGEAVEKLRTAASAGGELAGLAWLRTGQALLLRDPPDPEAASRAIEKAAGLLGKNDGEAGPPPAGGPRQTAELLYWQGEALLARGGEGLARAARAFGEVAERCREADPELAEKALYQAARASYLSGDRPQCAAQARRYRELYSERGRYLLESLQLSAENGSRAKPGEIDEEERRAAPRYYTQAASLAKEPAQARRFRYLAGVALETQGDHAGAARLLGALEEECRSQPLPGFDEPDLAFFLASALGQPERAGAAGSEDKAPMERAAALYEEYLRRKPGGDQAATAWINLGLARKRLGDLKAARRSFSAFLAAHPDHAFRAQVRFELASCLLAEGASEEALAEYRKTAEEPKAGPLAARAIFQVADLLLDQGQARAALEALKPLLEGSGSPPDRDRALYLQAWCFYQLAEGKPRGPDDSKARAAGEDEKPALLASGEAAYRRLIAEYPESSYGLDARVELAQRLLSRKDTAEAKKLLAAAREALEGRADGGKEPAGRDRELLDRALFGLGQAALEEKDYRQARDLFDRVAGTGEGELAARATLQSARAFLLSQKEDQALERLERLLGNSTPAAKPIREETLLRAGECYHRLGRYAESEKVLKRMLEEFPQGALRLEGLFALGFALQFQNETEGAVQAYRQVAAGPGSPSAARAQYHLGECFMDQKRFREAAREFLTVPANFDFEGPYREWVRRALLAAGRAYQAAGDEPAARAQYEELVKRFPDSEEGIAATDKLKEVKR
jgi:TolA-binding protein